MTDPRQLALVTLYGREYCGLCQQMREELRLLAPELGLDVAWFDIDDDDAVEEKYTAMVPVLAGQDDEVICFYHLDRRKLDAYLGRIR
ncbi:glutaredoxin family protein [Chitinimonas koreensis]|uniref:glutaredoxin family protein n=1 Tax=Chitinimonas koreensis TaxID=356302 RepID=UPI000491F035|nr:glutaredoxin family protein [Chitinimonas koreensis]QNM95580.1 glutaredoxin family protein [Chitinimonas koreensis]